MHGEVKVMYAVNRAAQERYRRLGQAYVALEGTKWIRVRDPTR